jgi:type 1 glutamine amidotransferase
LIPFHSDVSPPNATSVFSNASADAFAKYIERGGGYIGIHSASATAFLNPFYGHLVGAFFQYHPEIQPVGIRAVNTDNPSTSRFPSVLNINEEVCGQHDKERAKR